MSDKRHFSSEDVKSVGLRIKASRTLTGLNQEEFATKHEFSHGSIKAWEFGRVIPKIDGFQKMIEALRAEGIFVKLDWLLYGQGTGPSLFLESAEELNNESVLEDRKSLGYVEFFKTGCKKNKQNPIVSTVNDDEMAPYYRKGDIIAGILLDESDFPKKFLDLNKLSPMLTMTDNGIYVPRWVHITSEGVYTSSIKSPHVKKLEIVSIGRICWHQHL